ncbi:wall-associated receptor kinase-like 14 [Impatiens glandulifera]|uniref:wall-associated receptor kinase-like 14 n=1 Tax=Impatiens glandulifera TaxID=253017 RepID=UPI001FB0FDB2|nr:wall-associated receptor kinase-like 14 [Impatiens glandulifera]XP_047310730.1 wall-associated receptor kinase-like 14 [Impatiens glandulifera]
MMMMIWAYRGFQPVFRNLILVVSVVFYLFKAEGSDSSCNKTTRTCGSTSLSYPFGFSPSCPITLNCSADGSTKIGDFVVQNVTSDGFILVNLPDICNRSISDIAPLFGANFAVNYLNYFILQDCKSNSKNCIEKNFMYQRFNVLNCSEQNVNSSCYSIDQRLMSKDNLSKTGCKFLSNSVAVDSSNQSVSWQSSQVSFRFQMIKLEWWLQGNCTNCSANSSCSSVNGVGVRCQCVEGFVGDGFAGGEGCRKVAVGCHQRLFPGRHCGGSKAAILIGGVVLGASIMAIIACVCVIVRRRSSSLRTRMSAKRLLCEATGSSTVPLYHYREIERATNGFSEKQRLGTGAYGTVYAGKLFNDEWVAIKKIRHRDADGIEQVMNEVKLLSSVSHPNLVRLLGCCIENGEQILVYEYMPNGTLSQHLQKERGQGLPWTVRLTIATETANAIAYLHSSMNPPIFHRDIKSSNILLDYNFRSKVADFGLSRLGMENDSHISTAPQGTPGYVDPQYHQNFHLSDKSDVYSFGVVLLEIITSKKVVDFTRPHAEVNLAALAIDMIGKGRLDEIVDQSLEPNRDAWTLNSVHKVAELAFRCLAYHRDMRPLMTEVAEELEQIRVSSWATMDDDNNNNSNNNNNNTLMASSSIASTCSSPFNGSEKSMSMVSMSMMRMGVAGRKLVVPQRTTVDCLASLKKGKDGSPVSVQDPWTSEQSSPSATSLLGNVAK